jgi:hypothetical protein
MHSMPLPVQVAQVPPQPSSPHCLPVQFGAQHVLLMQLPPWHAQSAGHEVQSSCIAGSQTWSPHEACSRHVPETHRKPVLQPAPQVPPQPSSPHCLPVQFGMQHAPCKQRP